MSDPDDKRSSPNSVFLIGGAGLWLMAAAINQQGVGGYLRFIAAWAVCGAVILSVKSWWQWLWARRLWILVPAILALWIWIAGTYSLPRDLFVIAVSTALAIILFPDARSRVAALARRQEQPVSAFPLQTLFQLCWLILAWTLVSAADRFFESGAIERRGKAVTSAMPEAWRGLRVGMALSGGGYRAAIMHAGVLDEIAALGAPVTHLSSVSGGSIIGAFVAAGGAPSDFVEAVKNGRFRFFRDLTWIWNALLLPAPLHIPILDIDAWPFGNVSRVQVQADLVDRVLLGGAAANDPKQLPGPQLIMNGTDLRYGLSVGFMRSGVLFTGPVTTAKAMAAAIGTPTTAEDLPPAFYRYDETAKLEALKSLSQQVAVSGAFPGAFAPTEIQFSVPKPGRPRDQRRKLNLALVDGGVRDNLGINALLVADLLSRKPSAPSASGMWFRDNLDEDWSLDLILVSDGGQALQSASEISAIGSVFRAVDLNGLETGVLRMLPAGGTPRIEVLSSVSTFSFTPDQILSGVSPDDLRDKPDQFFIGKSVDLDTLAYMARLIPERAKVAPLLERFDAARREWAVHGGSFPINCVTQGDDAASRLGCARSAIVRAVGADIWRTFETFRQTPTLQDNFSRQAADEIYRLGQYLVRFHWNEIRTTLSAAAEARRVKEATGDAPGNGPAPRP